MTHASEHIDIRDCAELGNNDDNNRDDDGR